MKAAEMLGKVARLLIPDHRDVFVLGGIAIAAYGISLISVPLSFIFVGLLLFYLGIR